jgi:hypothetical protein
MRTVTLIFVAATLAIAGPADAKPKKKPAKAAKASPKDKFKPVGGPLPPLPEATELSRDFDVADDNTFALDVTEVASNATDATETISWTIGDWRQQLASDKVRIDQYREWFARSLEKAQRDDFPVAVRYLRTVYATATQFATLAAQTQAEFDNAFPADRFKEAAATPPEQARRVRLYRDKLNVLYATSRAFLDRTVQGRQEKIVRIE